MPLQNVTYGDLINSIATYIKNSCVNLNSTTYNNLPGTVKNGTAIDNQYSNGGGYTGHIYLTVSNGIPNLTTKTISQIESDIKSYQVQGSTVLSTIYPDAENISMPKFISFFNNIVSFCVGRMEFVTGGMNNITTAGANVLGDAYLSYKTSTDNTYKYSAKPDDIIYANSVNDVIEVLRTVLNRNIRSRIVSYVWSQDT